MFGFDFAKKSLLGGGKGVLKASLIGEVIVTGLTTVKDTCIQL